MSSLPVFRYITERKDEDEAELQAIREYNEKHKNKKSLLVKIKDFIKRLFRK